MASIMASISRASFATNLMSPQITLLSTVPSMRDAFNEHSRLLTAFNKAHKRSEKVGLSLGSYNDAKGKPVYELRAYWDKEHEAEVRWFATNVVAGGAK
jgi:hypothetical protein